MSKKKPKERAACISCEKVKGLYCMTCVKQLQISFSLAVQKELEKKITTLKAMNKALAEKTRKLASAQKACRAILDQGRYIKKIYGVSITTMLFHANIALSEMTAEEYVESGDNLGVLFREKLTSLCRQNNIPSPTIPAEFIEKAVVEVLFPEINERWEEGVK